MLYFYRMTHTSLNHFFSQDHFSLFPDHLSLGQDHFSLFPDHLSLGQDHFRCYQTISPLARTTFRCSQTISPCARTTFRCSQTTSADAVLFLQFHKHHKNFSQRDVLCDRNCLLHLYEQFSLDGFSLKFICNYFLYKNN